jgi:hypothetical protein
MRIPVAIVLAVALLAIPLACMAAGCDLSKPAHDCCPHSRALTSCPYDVLTAAKASRPPVPLWSHASSWSSPEVGVAPMRFTPEVHAQFAADGRDLHTRIRVLLI